VVNRSRLSDPIFRAPRKEEEILRRLFITALFALFVGGLWLLFRGGDRVSEEGPVLIMPADRAAILEQQVPRGSSAPSFPPFFSLPPRTSASERATPPTQAPSFPPFFSLPPRTSASERATPPTQAPSSPPFFSLPPRTSASERATPPIQAQPTVAGEARVNQADEDIFIVDGETLRPAIEEVGRTLSVLDAALSGLPMGMGLSISSAAGTGTLDSQGFTLTELRVAQPFGLEVGDTIVSLNGHRVNSQQSAWRIFRNLFGGDRDLTELQVEIHRRGARLYKTYRIRRPSR
jgi:hypothetical protein